MELFNLTEINGNWRRIIAFQIHWFAVIWGIYEFNWNSREITEIQRNCRKFIKIWRNIRNDENVLCSFTLTSILISTPLLNKTLRQYSHLAIWKNVKTKISELKDLDHKISLINKNDPDYLDILYREKFNYVKEDEIIIKLKWVKKLDTKKK